MTRSCPPQRGQRVMSMSKTRFNRCAQGRGAVGGSMPSPRESVEGHGWVAGGEAVSLSFLHRRALATASACNGERLAIEADRAALDRINTYATLPEYYIDRPFTCRCCGKREIWRARVRRADDRSTEVRRA